MTLSRWAESLAESGGWVRRMFAEGQRLKDRFGEDAVADLALGQPLDEPPEAVREALLRAAAERGRARFGYMPNLGYREVRDRVAADVGHPGLDGSCIAMTGGAGAALCLALHALVDAGDEVLGISPYFGEYPQYAATVGATFVSVPARADGSLDLDAVAGALSPRTSALILNTPCNPTGHVVAHDELTGLAAVLEEHARRGGRRVVLLVDAVYQRLVYPPHRHLDALATYPTTAVARSFSKDLGLAGERIGYLAVAPDLATREVMRGLELCQRALGLVNAPATMQRMLLHLERWDVDLSPFQERRDHALGLARAAGLDVLEPQGALYLWARSPWPDGLAFAQALAARRVIVAPGIAFGARDHLRLCFTAPRAAVERAMAVMTELGAAEVPA